MRQGAARGCACVAAHSGGLCGCIASANTTTAVRGYTRGIPYTPQGTIQDYTSSPRHVRLAEMQRNIDREARRAPTGLYEGPTITTKDGARPLFPPEKARHPNRGPPPRGATPPTYAPQFVAPAATREDMMPPQSDSYQRDLRSDPAYADDPEHIVAARQRIMTMQSDSYGEAMRGMVAPPPPLDPDAPQAYRQPRVQLDDNWWILMWSFAALFVVMAMYGK
ncbi:conserved hypothetical protein [Leishmania major strain Friedlin]|uniref:Uncharacterized protein n=1 Tax=Leishmania major TaxID=5664 RepID=Q4QBF2_LEIMA|nr:conserved hypothetical protein [Leishmania major strain Friedlin]CAG9574114.1 hypothetical_protein_-_conserved [Leishmania major strain Friedlin]CAJ03959.1 conserved hypothetical protein [Leishmania major strain Friedlin]|eukprot:XP_001683346.1 conserved hypothetical protein [Leishmania major strain Friedlin]